MWGMICEREMSLAGDGKQLLILLLSAEAAASALQEQIKPLDPTNLLVHKSTFIFLKRFNPFLDEFRLLTL